MNFTHCYVGYTVDEAVTICYNAIFANMGQCCCAGSRTFVHEKIYDEFVKKATALAAARKVGNPFDEGVEQGPQVNISTFNFISPVIYSFNFTEQVSEEQYNKVLELVESGKKEGAAVTCGGNKWGTEGFFVEPTVFADVTDGMRIAKEEVYAKPKFDHDFS